MWHYVLFPAIALGSSAYIWFRKPGIILSYMMRYSLKQTGVTIKYVQGDKYSYAYAERGTPSSNLPSLVFIHGFSASKDNWTPILKRLPKQHHVIAVDLLGHGESTVPCDPDHATVDCLLDHLHEMIHLIPGLIDRPFHMLGTSMGGLITAAYSSKYPQEVLKVTLVCPAMITPVMTEFMKNSAKGEVSLLLPKTTDDIQKMMNACLYDKKKVVTNKQIMMGVLQLRAPKENFNQLLFSHMTDPSKEKEHEIMFEEAMTHLKAPTQIIWGEDDELIHVSGVDRLKTLLPKIARIDIIEKCGHATHWDQPDTLTANIVSFLDSS